MKIIDRKTGEEKSAVYAANTTGNMRYNVDGKFLTDKQFDKRYTRQNEILEFKCHTPLLLKEIVEAGLRENQGVLKIPLNVLRRLLVKVANRAAEINDPIMNHLMCLLTFYEVADPESKEFDTNILEDVKLKAIAAGYKVVT